MALDSLNVILLVVLSAVSGILVYRSSIGLQQQRQVNQTPSVVEVVTSEYPRPDPYWVNYGLPEYWPAMASPYNYYDVPMGYWGGYGSGGYGRPGRGHPSHRGYSGVASGGGGGGGGGGGRSGGGGGHGGGGGGR
jgi:hypothetical protein